MNEINYKYLNKDYMNSNMIFSKVLKEKGNLIFRGTIPKRGNSIIEEEFFNAKKEYVFPKYLSLSSAKNHLSNKSAFQNLIKVNDKGNNKLILSNIALTPRLIDPTFNSSSLSKLGKFVNINNSNKFKSAIPKFPNKKEVEEKKLNKQIFTRITINSSIESSKDESRKHIKLANILIDCSDIKSLSKRKNKETIEQRTKKVKVFNKKKNIIQIDENIQLKADHDMATLSNEEDSLLANLNSNCTGNNNNNNNNQNLNTSIDSVCYDHNKCLINIRDMELISSYIIKYYEKNNKYPSTKIKFYKYGRLLGKGAFGKVNVSLHVLTGRLVAIKSINKKKLVNKRQKSKITLETSIMKTLSKSNNIVQIYETFETQKHFCIVMEYICAGDLLSYIKKRGKLTESIAKYIFKQIILALQYIHSHHIVHRDIKLDNILIDIDNNIKICDFGVSRIITSREIMQEQCGTPAYMAPEILKGKGYSGYSVDLWSVGVVLYAMLSGNIPFKGGDIKELHNKIEEGIFKEVEGISNEASQLISLLLEVDPKKRITAEKALYHPWLINVDLNAFKANHNLFTKAENILLAKSNVDYRDANNKNDMIENFSLHNLDTKEEKENYNRKSKSLILAPFNSSIEDIDNKERLREELCDVVNDELKEKNNLIKFVKKVEEVNRLYELNNNGEIDNGKIISQNNSSVKIQHSNEKKDFSPINNEYNDKSPQYNEVEDLNLLIDSEINQPEREMVNDSILNQLEKLGYHKSAVAEQLEKNEFNYATTSYYLLLKHNNNG